jgi:hypothetical protein
VVGAAIWLVIVGLPALVVLGIALFVGFRVLRRISPSQAKAKEQGPGD